MKTIIAIILFSTLMSGCSRSPKYIEEGELRDIITEAIVTDAILLQSHKNRETDTLDYYTTILARAGYTRQDMEYTIRQMAARKSNPLDNLFDEINKSTTDIANRANYRYKKMEKYDTLAMNYCTDTLYKKDTLIKGALKKFTIDIPAKNKGFYTILFDYQTHNSYDVPTRQVETHFIKDTVAKTATDERTMWVNRSFEERQFLQTIELSDTIHNRLKIKLSEPKLSKPLTFKDTSYIKNIRVYYQPTKSDARNRYLKDFTGLTIDTVKIRNDERYFKLPKRDSLPGPVTARR